MRDISVVPFSNFVLHGLGRREECLSRGSYIISSVLELIDRDPEFRFTIGNVAFVDYFLSCHPEQKARFVRQIQRGAIEVGPEWTEIPQNLQIGEDIVRNLMYGQRYLKEISGSVNRTVVPVDLTGWTSQFPQIAKQCEIEWMVWLRMGPEGVGLFRWQGIDGSQLLVRHSEAGSRTLWQLVDGIRSKSREHLESFQEVVKKGSSPAMVYWGMDLTAPTENQIEKLKAWCEDHNFRPAMVTPSHTFGGFDGGDDLPTFEGEVPSARPFTEATFPGIVPLNVPAVHRLAAAEKFTTAAHLLAGHAYPAVQFREFWLKLLEAMDHHYGATGGGDTDKRKARTQRCVIWWAEDVIRSATRTIAERVKFPAEPRGALPIVVFNPTSWTRTDVVNVHVSFYGLEDPSKVPFDMYTIVDAEGRKLPFQDLAVERISTTEIDLVFEAENVPADGYATFYLLPSEQETTALLGIQAPGLMAPGEDEPKFVIQEVSTSVSAPYRGIRTGRTFSNDFYDLTIDEVTGFVRVHDRRLNRIIFDGLRIKGEEESLNRGYFQYDPTGRVFELSVDRVDLIESGEVLATVLVEGRLLTSPVELRFTLYRSLDRIDLEVRLAWQDERPMRVQLEFPTEGEGPQKIHYGSPYGMNALEALVPRCSPKRDDELEKKSWEKHRECSGWISVDQGEWGFVIASDRRSYEVDEGYLRGELLRSIPAEESRDYRLVWKTYPREIRANYSLRSYPGDFRSASVWRDGWGLNNPLNGQSVADTATPKSLPAKMSFFKVYPLDGGTPEERIIVPVLKRAEDDDSVIVRAFEPAGEALEGRLGLCERTFVGYETNMLEEKIGDIDPERVGFRPFEIKTFKLNPSEG